ncbi:Na(+)/H(+) antiporter NhaA [Ktedonobacter sp. SOSP1-52]|uniref:Na+/H+ antiporter NhaA n=1 Tax=Ktedonobacter sp. SOSP1-52 TaxID=2778366 RepID=UPI001916B9B1|nr:Na+/H+ antiporter NhaA [Ktedonobacter sp. SOSP1-52]GHO65349.1 Na(+)/H(+) antiporter NhaA [Ktedonobacter sp. SOSP1-52]
MEGLREFIRRPTGEGIAGRLLQPFQAFAQAETTSGLLLILCICLALVWANSPWAGSYEQLWEIHLVIHLGGYGLDKPLHTWINDGLMVLFFFLVGLELKRETLVGELSKLKQATFSLAAAIGGAICPALIYLLWNAGTPGIKGWAIPMATDTAFALGILALLGGRITWSLKVFVIAYAIFDDILAVLIIATFYTEALNWLALIAAAGVLLCVLGLNLAGVRWIPAYALLGIVLWWLMFISGVHATVAGILLALLIPTRARINAGKFLAEGHAFLDEFERGGRPGLGLHMNDQQVAAVQALEVSCEQIQTPSQRLEHSLYYPVSFVIVPLFVLANAGLDLRVGLHPAELLSTVTLGVMLGLVVGKQLGIILFSWLAVKVGWADLPEQANWRHIYGVSWLGGIGFTMSLFIADLAFEGQNPLLLTEAKMGILLAALVSGGGGYLFLRLMNREREASSERVVSEMPRR